MPPRVPVKKGDRYGRLSIRKEIDRWVSPSGNSDRQFLCVCDCGTKVKVTLCHLRTGHTQSCGCLHKEAITTQNGMSAHPMYNVWVHMLGRCHSKNHEKYELYGARGIRVCKSWRDKDTGFLAFMAWNASLPERKQWRKGLEIDREDNDEGYYPWNCRWVTSVVNTRNRRDTVIVKEGPHKGRIFANLFDEIGHSSITLRVARKRYRRYGWTAVSACTTPNCVRSSDRT